MKNNYMIPKAEHPNPQWERERWLNLNGEWEFEFDFGASAVERERYKEPLERKITVPFCPESKLSGIEYKDFIGGVCYRRKVDIKAEELKGRVIIHFGAVNYEAVLYVNGEKAGVHTGGYSSFEFDITDFLNEGENILFVSAVSDVRSGKQPHGKQAGTYNSQGCVYTRCTGIWQTVWLEFVPQAYLKSAKIYPDIHNSSVTVMGLTDGKGDVFAEVYLDGNCVGSAKGYSDGNFNLYIPLSEKKLWEPGNGVLYDLQIHFCNDDVKSYFGMRKVSIDEYKVCINDKPVFQRLALDQGYYPDGVYTARDDDALIKDIEISVAAGFNGARLHEKVFEPRFLYHADRMGYIVWGEYPDWGTCGFNNGALNELIAEWTEVMQRDFNHPSIVMWCPMNEQIGYMKNKYDKRAAEVIYKITKAADSTRPCIDTSGGCHSLTDIFDIHDYEQNTETFFKRYSPLAADGECCTDGCDPKGMPFFTDFYTYKKGTPVCMSEYGGMKWPPEKSGGWGYGDDLKTEEDFINRYRCLTEQLLFNKNMFGFCYTQLYDVEQEQNGLYTYDREPKFDMNIFKKINSQTADIEK